MQLQLNEIKEFGVSHEFVNDAKTFPELTALEAEGECRFSAPLSVTVRLTRVGGLVEVAGQLATLIETGCSRCLKRMTTPLEASFELTYTNEPIMVHEEEDEEGEGVELTAEELGLIPFSGDEIDLTEAVQEQVLLAMPTHPLCSEECRGLCPQCGLDLNTGSCSCAAEEFGNKFAVLKNFKVDR